MYTIWMLHLRTSNLNGTTRWKDLFFQHTVRKLDKSLYMQNRLLGCNCTSKRISVCWVLLHVTSTKSVSPIFFRILLSQITHQPFPLNQIVSFWYSTQLFVRQITVLRALFWFWIIFNVEIWKLNNILSSLYPSFGYSTA